LESHERRRKGKFTQIKTRKPPGKQANDSETFAKRTNTITRLQDKKKNARTPNDRCLKESAHVASNLEIVKQAKKKKKESVIVKIIDKNAPG
jgi:hypothetical protein